MNLLTDILVVNGQEGSKRTQCLEGLFFVSNLDPLLEKNNAQKFKPADSLNFIIHNLKIKLMAQQRGFIRLKTGSMGDTIFVKTKDGYRLWVNTHL